MIIRQEVTLIRRALEVIAYTPTRCDTVKSPRRKPAISSNGSATFAPTAAISCRAASWFQSYSHAQGFLGKGAAMSEEFVFPDNEKMRSLKTLTLVVYILYALSYFTGITAIVGIIINNVKLEEVAGSWLESHFRWQIRTFWFGLLWFVLAGILFITIIGIPFAIAVWFGSLCWIIYRVVKGWLNLNDNKPMTF
jgi:uncharacterized membrane protein